MFVESNPLIRLQWGHDLSVVESPCSSRRRRPNKSFNGATTSRSWNPVEARVVYERDHLLQWGHDLSVVESGGAPEIPRVESGLQWGHDLSVVESARRADPRLALGPASMGPRPLGRGIDLTGVAMAGQILASMGPRPLGRGIGRSAARRSSGSSGFNGATTSRSWNPAALRRAVRRTSGFNGATTSRSWNPASREFPAEVPKRLQWGHDLSVVESPRPRRGSARARAASMGPRPLGRGIRRSGCRSVCAEPASMGPRPLGRGILTGLPRGSATSSTLQWGHDLSVVESGRRARRLRRRVPRLQWGHDLSVVESGGGP